MSRKVLLITGDGGDTYETLYAGHRLLEDHWEPVIAAPTRRRLHMLFMDHEPGFESIVERPGHWVDAHVAITAVAAKDFVAVLLLGGRAPEYMRNDPSLLSLVREFAGQDKCIFAIGHGIQILAAAGLTRGRTVACHEAVRVEIEKDGGRHIDKPAWRDGKLVTAPTWRYHPEFYREVFACLEAEKQ
jgi:protease I